MTHIFVGNLTIIGSINGLSPCGTKPLSEPMLGYCQKAFENDVCKTETILSRPRYVKALKVKFAQGPPTSCNTSRILHISHSLLQVWVIDFHTHYNDVIMSTMAYQITSRTIVYSIVNLSVDIKKTSKLHVTGLCEGNSPETRKIPRSKGQ